MDFLQVPVAPDNKWAATLLRMGGVAAAKLLTTKNPNIFLLILGFYCRNYNYVLSDYSIFLYTMTIAIDYPLKYKRALFNKLII